MSAHVSAPVGGGHHLALQLGEGVMLRALAALEHRLHLGQHRGHHAIHPALGSRGRQQNRLEGPFELWKQAERRAVPGGRVLAKVGLQLLLPRTRRLCLSRRHPVAVEDVLDALKKRMLQCLRGGQAQRRVVGEQLVGEVHGAGGRALWEDFVPGVRLEFRQVLCGAVRAHHTQLLLRRSAEKFHDLDEMLLGRVLPLEGQMAQEELDKDGTDRPHVHGRRVLRRPKHELRRAVVARADVRHVRLPFDEHLGAPKVDDL